MAQAECVVGKLLSLKYLIRMQYSISQKECNYKDLFQKKHKIMEYRIIYLKVRKSIQKRGSKKGLQ